MSYIITIEMHDFLFLKKINNKQKQTGITHKDY